MSGTGIKHNAGTDVLAPMVVEEQRVGSSVRTRQAELLRLLWDRRRFVFRVCVVGLLLSTLMAFLIPKSYTSTAQLMPPDSQSSSALAMMTALAGKAGASLAGLTGDLLGLKSSGALFIGVLRSQTSQDHIIQQFNLKRVYGTRLDSDARKELDDNTNITEDRKSGIITIRVTDHNAQRAAAIANAYIDELNSLVARLSTSAAHRERVFLEDRLRVAKMDLDDASSQLAQFSSKNNTLDVQTEGKAMLDAAASLTGQLIAAESQLEGLRQIYTDSNPRVRALTARVTELRKQLEKFGGTEEVTHSNGEHRSNAPPLQAADPTSVQGSGSPFPTIRNLPLLGAKYADYYRRAKIQETVFELLTEQYELAKIQEAKETPSVKVLDPAMTPERKSFPPRLPIMFLGTTLAFIASIICILTARMWAEIDPADPRKALALEVAASVRINAFRVSQNGDMSRSWLRRLFSRLKSQEPPSGGASGV